LYSTNEQCNKATHILYNQASTYKCTPLFPMDPVMLVSLNHAKIRFVNIQTYSTFIFISV